MFRWPIQVTPLSLGGAGLPREAMLEVTPRGALFTLAALSHVGHPAHLALIDAYLKGQVRLTPSSELGEDSRTVAASLAAPLVAAHELGVERLSLADLVLLPPDPSAANLVDRAADGRPVSGPDAPRMLLRAHGVWRQVHAAERFEVAGCLGTQRVGQGEAWHHVVVELPSGAEMHEARRAGRRPPTLQAEVRAPSGDGARIDDAVAGQARTEALARFAPTPGVAVREPDGFRTLCLLPPSDADPASLFDTMLDLARETIEGLIGRPLPERRTEPIVLRLVGADGRETALDVGASVVIGRNQVVFAAWVGSDGRVMVRLFPSADGGPLVA